MSTGLMQPPRILLFTGKGKGKTSAVMGLALRAAGHGMQVRIQQFVKRPPGSAEALALQLVPNICISQCGLGFVPNAETPAFQSHRHAAETGLDLISAGIARKAWDVVILDEICVAVAKGLLAESSVLALITSLPQGGILALSGRGATPNMIAAADTVTCMTCVKHALDAGRQAQRGVEL